MTVSAHGTETITTPTGAKHDAPAMPRLPIIEDTGKVTPKDARQLSGLLFDRLQSLEEGTPEYSRTRSTLIEMNMSLVGSAHGASAAVAIRRRRTSSRSDIGLIKAIDRFDLSREVEFTTFAVPYMEDFHVLAPMLHELGEREQTLLRLRFAQEMTQAEIGAELGYSQMHISRILSRTLTKLRAGMLTDR